VELKAAHIAGKDNELADRLSRYKWSFSRGDWMLARRHFEEAQERAGVLFTIDGAADPVGSNAQLPTFCSEVDSFFEHDLRHHHVYVNPDFALMGETIDYGKAQQALAPYTTSVTVVAPEWTTAAWWKKLKGSEVVAYIPKGSRAFTAPEWRGVLPGHPPSQRADRGVTRWGTVVSHFPALLPCRRGERGREAGSVRLRDGASTGGRQRRPLCQLRGEPRADAAVLRGLSQTPVP
jgi:hypothetical protein